MSFSEVAELLKMSNRQLYEKERLSCFFTLLSQGSEIKNPQDIIRFGWEKKIKKEGKRLTKEELKKKAEQAKKYIKNGRR